MKKIEKQLKSVEASLEIEGLTLDEEMKQLILKEAKGEISFEEFEKIVKELAEK